MTTETTTELRRCIGSTRFGIEAHEAPISDFPVQASQKDDLGRMCKAHWREYTNALRKAAVARKMEATAEAPASEPGPEVVETPDAAPESEAPAPRKTRRATAESEEEADAA